VSDTGFIPRDDWKAFVEGLTKRLQVFAPVKNGDTITFQRLGTADDLCLDRPATSSPKAVIFPQSETLFTFTFKKDADYPKKMDVELNAATDMAEAAILCGRPCDARGFVTLDPVYKDTDPYYRNRREKTIFLTLACANPYPACFCTSVGGGPADKTGSDVIITGLENGYFLEALTEKGKALLDDSKVQDGATYQAEAEKRHKAAHDQVKKAFEGGKDVKIDEKRFLSDEFWDGVSAKCVSCGACTYLCPTCYCFNITDEQGVSAGERIRSWDSCMFPHFTLEASGHNPRGQKAQRLRQRVGHKFVYYPEKYGEPACSGCGRCIRHCPVAMDISRIVARLAEKD
jgi:sulfhydrogenase subunit beta (sulfur reductase)